MTFDTQRTLDVMTNALLRELGDEVELIFRFGSQIKGNTHAYSDVDISYVPVHEETWNSITVLVDDTLVDLFALHWSQLERWANFDDVRGTVLLNAQIVYQRSPEVAARFQALAARLRALQEPSARRAMQRKAQELFQTTGYADYLLRQQAAQGHLLACLHQAQNIVKTVLHVLAICNQMPIDTRKLAQVLALPKLPENLAALVERVTFAHTPETLLLSCEALLEATRAFLLAEQRELPREEKTFAAVFDAGYPEFRGDIQHVLLACQQEDMFSLRDKLMSLYHELMFHLTLARTGVESTSFNTLAEYEQEFGALGFPALWEYVVREDYAGLHQACQRFDERLREFLTEHGVALYSFATTEALQDYLETQARR